MPSPAPPGVLWATPSPPPPAATRTASPGASPPANSGNPTLALCSFPLVFGVDWDRSGARGAAGIASACRKERAIPARRSEANVDPLSSSRIEMSMNWSKTDLFIIFIVLPALRGDADAAFGSGAGPRRAGTPARRRIRCAGRRPESHPGDPSPRSRFPSLCRWICLDLPSGGIRGFVLIPPV